MPRAQVMQKKKPGNAILLFYWGKKTGPVLCRNDNAVKQKRNDGHDIIAHFRSHVLTLFFFFRQSAYIYIYIHVNCLDVVWWEKTVFFSCWWRQARNLLSLTKTNKIYKKYNFLSKMQFTFNTVAMAVDKKMETFNFFNYKSV